MLQVYSSSCEPSYSLTHLFPKTILDQDKNQTTCFSLHKDLLICGTENGYIKLLDINSEKILVKARVNSYYISDIKYHQGRLISLDCFGNILHWKLLEVPPFLQALGNESPEVPFLLQQRNIERLLDFGSDDLILTTFKSHITVYKDNAFLVSFPVYSDVFCIDKQDKLVGFGCKGGVDREFVNPVAGIVLIDPTSPPFIPRIYFRTPDNDPVISIQLTSRFLILGDINGEIHLINVENLDIPSGESFRDLKPSDITTLRSHGYRDFVWALNTDGFRLFSGDETGQIIVHDFLHVDAQNAALQDAQTPALKMENVKDQDEQDSVDKDV
ncbi:uncharacterized protein LOC111715495 [Eurytemora carolleeae]|uniref:uncharacterized protein LOC111715495 n=1 Tax=Eurytemora carolleeae TaxID=1294199 RepID=UPI000C761AF1|nr:uncharacterized protein LOC111715495 [Eurytemora carolleeae]|eukprot:XP_023346593.1 uncharacterized protein LOC111715495 [Eurytemora affinis]